jgi:hypothetical protein
VLSLWKSSSDAETAATRDTELSWESRGGVSLLL